MADVRIIDREIADRLGEGPLWSPSQNAVYWVDILSCAVNRLVLATGRIDRWTLPEMVGWLIERNDAGGFLAGLASGVKSVTLDPVTVRAFADLPGHPKDHRLNDAKADAFGNVWAGTLALTGDRPTGALHRVAPDGSVQRVDDGYMVPNGPAMSADGTLFHTDSGTGTIYRFAFRDDGSLGPREIFVQFDNAWGSPDGMTFDADGGLWVAHWGGSRISRFDPAGKIERSIALPASQITSMTFAGAALDRMFVTSAAKGVSERHAGALFEVDPGCHGLAPHRFGITI